MTDLGDVFHYFRIEINVNFNKKTIYLQQSTYLKKILGYYDISNCKLAKIFISPRIANSFIFYENQVDISTIA